MISIKIILYIKEVFYVRGKKNSAELTDKVLSVMITDNYSRKSVDNHIRYVYCALTKFCDDHFEGEYLVEAGEAFYEDDL